MNLKSVLLFVIFAVLSQVSKSFQARIPVIEARFRRAVRHHIPSYLLGSATSPSSCDSLSSVLNPNELVHNFFNDLLDKDKEEEPHRKFFSPPTSFPTPASSSPKQYDSLSKKMHKGDGLQQSRHKVHMIPMDIQEVADGYHLFFDIPGIEKDSVDVKIKDKELFITGQRDSIVKQFAYLQEEKEKPVAADSKSTTNSTSSSNIKVQHVTSDDEDDSDYDEVDDEEYFSHIERKSGSYRRVLSLPEGVDRHSIAADIKNGVLHLMIKKTPESLIKEIKVNVN
jgi:HSP20 family molecular chaperone IbpA